MIKKLWVGPNQDREKTTNGPGRIGLQKICYGPKLVGLDLKKREKTVQMPKVNWARAPGGANECGTSGRFEKTLHRHSNAYVLFIYPDVDWLGCYSVSLVPKQVYPYRFRRALISCLSLDPLFVKQLISYTGRKHFCCLPFKFVQRAAPFFLPVRVRPLTERRSTLSIVHSSCNPLPTARVPRVGTRSTHGTPTPVIRNRA